MRMVQVFVIATLSAAASNAHQQSPLVSAPFHTTERGSASEQMRVIVDALAGSWSINWIDKDGRVIGEGEEVWTTAPGGIPFTEENRSTVNGKPAEDYAAMWWDSKAQTVRGIWCDATINDEGCSGFNVSLEGRNVVLTGEWEFGGKRQSWREVFNVKGMALTQTLAIGKLGGEMRAVSTIHGRKR